MPVTLKQNGFKYKNPDTGNYVSFDVVADETMANRIATINAAADTKV